VKNSEEQNQYLERSVNIIFDAMDKLAGGDLTVNIVPEKEDMIGKLFNKFNNVIANISGLLGNIKAAVDDLGYASGQIAGSSKQIAAGTQDQVQQIQNASGAVEEMARTIQESTQFSRKASESSRLASDSAKNGAKKVQDTKQGMLKIVSSTKLTGEKITLLANQSDQIGEIAQVIDDIADQTNLLALNAAIEAARAGEQGRGFAVVADEVRKLAERTTKATKEIADTIKNIQIEAKEADSSMSVAEQAVLEGMQLTEEVAITLEEMLSKNDQVSDMINMVANSGDKQSAAAGNMLNNIEDISAVTLQSKNGTELIAQSAEDLNHLAQVLQNLVMKFKLIENGNKFSSNKLTERRSKITFS
jgi:methyl-accepting chemotaxis protein